MPVVDQYKWVVSSERRKSFLPKNSRRTFTPASTKTAIIFWPLFVTSTRYKSRSKVCFLRKSVHISHIGFSVQSRRYSLPEPTTRISTSSSVVPEIVECANPTDDTFVTREGFEIPNPASIPSCRPLTWLGWRLRANSSRTLTMNRGGRVNIKMKVRTVITVPGMLWPKSMLLNRWLGCRESTRSV